MNTSSIIRLFAVRLAEGEQVETKVSIKNRADTAELQVFCQSTGVKLKFLLNEKVAGKVRALR